MAQRDFSNILAGPCRISVGGADLGHTSGETRFELKPILRPVTADCCGSTAVDFVHLGEEATVTARVAEWTLATLGKIYPVSAEDGNTLTFGSAPGTRLSALAETLVLHPLELAAGDASRDVTFHKAVAAGAVAAGFSNEGDRVFEVVFRILPDLDRDDGERFGTIGAA